MVVKICALYWEQFGRGAELPVEPGCFDRAVRLGALANVRKNIEILAEFGKTFKEAEGCSYKAGVNAKALAAKAKLDTITPDIYEQAFNMVATQVQRVASRAPAGTVRAEGILC